IAGIGAAGCSLFNAPPASSSGGGGGGGFAGRRSSTSSSTPTALNRQILRSWATRGKGGGGVVGGGGSGGYLRGRQQRLSSGKRGWRLQALLSVIRSALGWGERPTAPDSNAAAGGGAVGKEGQLAEPEAQRPSAVSPDLLTESTADSAPPPAVEDVEEADMRHAEEVISSIDAEHRLIELAPSQPPPRCDCVNRNWRILPASPCLEYRSENGKMIAIRSGEGHEPGPGPRPSGGPPAPIANGPWPEPGEVVRIVSSFNNKCFVGSLSMHRSHRRGSPVQPRDRRGCRSMLGAVLACHCSLSWAWRCGPGRAPAAAPVAEVLPLNTDVATIEAPRRPSWWRLAIEELPFPPAALEDVAKTFYITKQDRKDRRFHRSVWVSTSPTCRTLCRQSRPSTRGPSPVHLSLPGSAGNPDAARGVEQRLLLAASRRREAGLLRHLSDWPQRRRAELPLLQSPFIKSCCRLSYEEAEQMLNSDEFPPIGGVQPFLRCAQLCASCISWLKSFRKERLSKAALGFSVANKLQFTCPDGVNGVPPADEGKRMHEWSHQLVEEWMLKANVPRQRTLRQVEAPDAGPAPSATSAQRHPARPGGDSWCRWPDGGCVDRTTRNSAASQATLAIMQMSLAEYICTGYHPDRDSWRHSLLEVPSVHAFHFAYTCDTPTCSVHRQLVGALGLSSPTTQAQQQQQQQQQRAAGRRSGGSPGHVVQQVRASAPSERRRAAQPAPSFSMRAPLRRHHRAPSEGSSRLPSLSAGSAWSAPGPGGETAAEGLQTWCFPPAGSCPHRLTLKLNFRSEVPVYLERNGRSAPHSLSIVADSDESELRRDFGILTKSLAPLVRLRCCCRLGSEGAREAKRLAKEGRICRTARPPGAAKAAEAAARCDKQQESVA
uniref:ANK_REP_REGION domain-containing protein n=1 Tax=Macrostomum lignano TaxID=282301 RepID=A0A1I8FDC7_9PLAT